jgi:hypothetical protein
MALIEEDLHGEGSQLRKRMARLYDDIRPVRPYIRSIETDIQRICVRRGVAGGSDIEEVRHLIPEQLVPPKICGHIHGHRVRTGFIVYQVADRNPTSGSTPEQRHGC